MVIVGIDPGQKGAIVELGDDIFVHPMPGIADVRNLLDASEPYHVFIEKAQSFPGQGISSAFNYGVHFGELLGCIQALGIAHTLVPPRTWTKVMHAGCAAGEPKERSLEAARRLFPSVNLVQPRCKKPHDGIVDALLIAEYGRRVLNGK